MSQIPAFAHNPSRVITSPPAASPRSAEPRESRPMTRPGTLAARVSSGCAPKSAKTSSRAGSPRMDSKRIEGDTVRLSVPTRFLKSWIQSHYTDSVLACWQAEHADVRRIELSVRSAVLRTAAAKAKPSEPVETAREPRNGTRRAAANARAAQLPVAGRARGARRLAARSAADLRELRGRPLQHAGACRRQAGRAGAARRAGDVQSALHPCRRRPRQDAPAAGDRLGRQRRRRAQGALSHRREVHVRLRRGAARRRRRSPSRKRCAASTCW